MPESVNNIVLVVVDALRADRVGAYSGSSLTPTIDALADRGEVFERCYSCVNATDSSLTTILTGQYPTRHGVLNQGENITEAEKQYAAGTTSVASLLQETHRTIGVDWMGRWHERGFDTYGTESEDASSNPLGMGLVNSLPSTLRSPLKFLYRSLFVDEYVSYVEGEQVTDFALDQIENTDEPWFLFAHYWDAHLPYVSPGKHPDEVEDRTYEDGDVPIEELIEPIAGSEWHELLTDEFLRELTTVGDLKRRYDAGVRLVDEQIGRVVDYLEAAGIYDETAIIVTADHGESLTEHGIYFDHHGLYDQSVHVPLIVDAPGFSGRETAFVQHFDLAPTILELAGSDESIDADGESLVPDTTATRSLDRDAVYMEEGHAARKRAIRTSRHKYIVDLEDSDVCRYCGVSHAPTEELYDLDADPGERRNIIDDCPETAAELGERLAAWTDSLEGPSEGRVQVEDSDQAMQRLEDMGYL
ncbi:sulfatase [Halomicrobium salinisoli]|uniref:sulfatase family protein n=1 Tax=Halomicrobium salinisoli TaxID=2878391 RepID=UPI001CEFD058|nr:sulfatase [Halomicrobium salinisoli]